MLRFYITQFEHIQYVQYFQLQLFGKIRRWIKNLFMQQRELFFFTHMVRGALKEQWTMLESPLGFSKITAYLFL